MKFVKIILFNLIAVIVCSLCVSFFYLFLQDTISTEDLNALCIFLSISLTFAACLTVNRFVFLHEEIKELQQRLNAQQKERATPESWKNWER